MEVKLFPHANEVETEFRLLQNCAELFIFWSFLPVLSYVKQTQFWISNWSLTLDSYHQHFLLYVHLENNSSSSPYMFSCTDQFFLPSVFALGICPSLSCLVSFHLSKVPCFWDYANKSINHSGSFSKVIAFGIFFRGRENKNFISHPACDHKGGYSCCMGFRSR